MTFETRVMLAVLVAFGGPWLVWLCVWAYQRVVTNMGENR